MSTTQDSDFGRLVWHDLFSSDPGKARVFYSELLGWKTREVPMGPQTYCMITAGERDIGGIEKVPAPGVPSYWAGYVSVADVDATTKQVEELGGTTVVPPTEIPGVVRFAALKDPQGALFSICKSAKPSAPFHPRDTRPGMVCWNELWTGDPVAAVKFYGELFSWTTEESPMGEMGTYYRQKLGETDVGGIMKNPSPDTPPYWCPYFLVQDIDQDTSRAGGMSARLIMPATDIPEVGRYVILADPTGAVFSLFQGQGKAC